MGRHRFPPELMPLVKAAENRGWQVIQTRSSHIKFIPPSGSPYPIYTTGSSPSDVRSIRNARSFLKRCDVVEEGRQRPNGGTIKATPNVRKAAAPDRPSQRRPARTRSRGVRSESR